MKDITQKFPNLIEMEDTLALSRDFYEGASAIKHDATKREKYFPKGTQESNEGWEEKIASTGFNNHYQSAIMTLSGVVTQQEPIIEGVDEKFLKDADGKGTDFFLFMKKALTSSLVSGVEFISIENAGQKQRVFLKRYRYENLMSYHIKDRIIQEITFKEKVTNNKGGEYREVERYIRFRIGSVEIWQEEEGDNKIKKTTFKNKLKFVPIAMLITGKEKAEMQYIPPLFDLASQCLALLREGAKLANLTNIVSKPVFYAFGYNEGEELVTKYDEYGNETSTEMQAKESSLEMGPQTMLLFEDSQKNGVGFASPDTSSVEVLQEVIANKQASAEKMAFDSLTSREGSKTVIDAVGNQSRSTSFLTDLACETEECANKVLSWVLNITGKNKTKKFKCQFKKEFNEILFDKDKYEFLINLWQNQGLSIETILEIAKEKGVFPKNFDIPEEKKRIESEFAGVEKEEQAGFRVEKDASS